MHMYTLRKKLIAPSTMGILVAICSTMSRQAYAQPSGPTVTIAPLPLPVDASSQTVLAFDQTIEVTGIPVPGGIRLGPIDVGSFKQIRVAVRLVEGSSANVKFAPALQMTTSLVPNGTILLAPITTLPGTIVVETPGRTMFVLLFAELGTTTTCQIQVYGRK